MMINPYEKNMVKLAKQAIKNGGGGLPKKGKKVGHFPRVFFL